jgi:hypothetical protein
MFWIERACKYLDIERAEVRWNPWELLDQSRWGGYND